MLTNKGAWVKSIQDLSQLISVLSGLPLAGWIVLIALALGSAVSKSFLWIFGMWDRSERKRFEKINFYITNTEIADEESVKVMRDIRDADFFKIGTGIYAERKLRIAVIRLYERTSILISWRVISRAFPFLSTDASGELFVRELNRFESFGYWYNRIIGWGSFIMAVILFILLYFSGGKTFGSFGGSSLAAVVAFFSPPLYWLRIYLRTTLNAFGKTWKN